MAIVSVQELVDSGVHFGHQASRWNPRMRPYIFGKRNLIHVIDLKETLRGLLKARHFLRRLASAGAPILFVGTKRQIKDVVASEAERAGMPVVTERWLGGTLTNYHTIRSRLDRLEELEKLERDGTMEKYSKKLQSRLRRVMRKITRNLSGIRNLGGLPGAVIIVDPRREDIAVKEAAKMNVPIVSILDTDCDPTLIDIPIPGNDDALRSVQILLSRLVDGILEGKQNLDVDAALFSTEVPEIRGREDRDVQRQGAARGQGAGRGDRRPQRGGGRQPARVAGGRFADRSSKVETVSFGRQTQEEQEAETAKLEKSADESAGKSAEAAAKAPEPAQDGAADTAKETVTPEAVTPEAVSPADDSDSTVGTVGAGDSPEGAAGEDSTKRT